MASLLVQFGNGEFKSIELETTSTLTIGSHRSNDVRIEESGVEPMVARIAWNKKGFEIVSAGKKPLEINGSMVQRAMLRHADVIRIGTTDLTLSDDEAFEATEEVPDDLPVDDDEPLIPAEKPAASKKPSVKPATLESQYEIKPISDEIKVPPAKKSPPPPPSAPAPVVAPAPAKTKPTAPAAAAPTAPVKPAQKPQPKPAETSQQQKDARTEPAPQKAPAPPAASKGAAKVPERELTHELPEDERIAQFASLTDEDMEDEIAPVKSPPSSKAPPERDASLKEAGEFKLEQEKEKKESVSKAKTVEGEEHTEGATGPSLTERLRERLHTQSTRPGDQEILKSPLVLTLAGGSVALLLLGSIFYFLIGRTTAEAQYKQAQGLMDEGKFTEASLAFNKFLATNGQHPLVKDARRNMGIADIQQEIGGTRGKWVEGLEQLRSFIKVQRDESDFSSVTPQIQEYSNRIALKSAEAASTSFDRSFLQVSDDARAIFETYSDKGAALDEALKPLLEARRKGEADIVRNETKVAAIQQIEEFLKKQQPLPALIARRNLLVRYPELATDKDVLSWLSKSLDGERQLIKREDLNQPGLTDDHNAVSPALTMIFSARSRSDESSEGRVVLARAKDCLYAVDTATGLPVWRRVIGLDSPFFPISIDSGGGKFIACDAIRKELISLEPATGKLQWRQPLADLPTGPPAFLDGQLYVISASGMLYRFQADTGLLTARMQFPQPVNSPPVRLGEDHLILMGDSEVAYTLSTKPLECLAVSYLGQQPGAVQAPLLNMGPFILSAENSGQSSANIRVLRADSKTNILAGVASAPLQGRVVDPPVIRGRDLFVAHGNEQVSAFTVSDDPNQSPLVTGPVFQADDPVSTPVFLQTGSDGQLWMASTALRRLTLSAETIKPDERVINVGLASQPLQMVGSQLFVARRLAHSSAVTLTRTESRELTGNLTSDWQAILGASLTAVSLAENPRGLLLVATEYGDVFRVEAGKRNGEILTEGTSRVRLPEGLKTPVRAAALPGGQLAVWCGLPEAQLWVIGPSGQIERSLATGEELQASPVVVSGRLLLPLPGKLSLAKRNAGDRDVKDFLLPASDSTPAWKSLAPLSQDSAVALTADGTLLRVRVQLTGQPHLERTASFKLRAPAAHGFSLDGGKLAIVDSQAGLHLLDAETLQPVAMQSLPNPTSSAPALVGEHLFVETAGNTLHCFAVGEKLTPRWTLPLPNTTLAGPPVLKDETWIIPTVSGQILTVDETGKLVGTMNLGQPVTLPLIATGTELLAATLDGSLIDVLKVPVENSK